MDAVAVEILHTEGCLHWKAARRRVSELAGREGIAVAIDEIRIGTQEEAIARRFPGSPTIRVAGRDVAQSLAGSGSADFGLG